MKFYLRDRNANIVEEWKKFFGDNPDFEISQGDIFGVKADAITSPANSWGFMDGGIDFFYIMKFGQQLEDRLRELIAKRYYGELLVGQAIIIPTEHQEYKYLICAPTMRVPSVVKTSVNAYLAFRAALIAVKNHNRQVQELNHGSLIESILCPGLGIGVGQIHPFACAVQMFEAYKAIWLNQPLKPKEITDCWYQNQELTGWAPTELKVNNRDIANETL